MAAQAADLALLRRLTQLETDLDGMCKDIHRRRSPGKSCEPEPRPRTLAAHSRERRRRASPKPQSKAPGRGDFRRPPKSASASSLQPTLSAVLETPSAAARRIGASREDDSKTRCEIDAPKPSPSQSTTTASSGHQRHGSSSSGSCAALATVVSLTSLATHEAVSDASSDRCPQQVDSQLLNIARARQSPRSRLMGTSVTKSVGVPVERVELGDAEAPQAGRREDLVWQLELEKLRNATLELEVQREICESSDLRKRLWQNEAGPGWCPTGPGRVRQVPAAPTVVRPSSPVGAPAAARLSGGASRAGLAHSPRPVPAPLEPASTPRCAEAPGALGSHRALQFSPRHRGACPQVVAPVSPRLQ